MPNKFESLVHVDFLLRTLIDLWFVIGVIENTIWISVSVVLLNLFFIPFLALNDFSRVSIHRDGSTLIHSQKTIFKELCNPLRHKIVLSFLMINFFESAFNFLELKKLLLNLLAFIFFVLLFFFNLNLSSSSLWAHFHQIGTISFRY